MDKEPHSLRRPQTALGNAYLSPVLSLLLPPTYNIPTSSVPSLACLLPFVLKVQQARVPCAVLAARCCGCALHFSTLTSQSELARLFLQDVWSPTSQQRAPPCAATLSPSPGPPSPPPLLSALREADRQRREGYCPSRHWQGRSGGLRLGQEDSLRRVCSKIQIM